jgi:hypothetical protein
MLCSLRFQASIPARYWVEGLHTATYLLNHLRTKAIGMISPYITLHRVAPSYEQLHMFGSACYPNLSTKAAHKLAPQSSRCIFLEYSTDHKGYRCLNITNNNIVISRHTIFDEADFPFSASPCLTNDLDIFCMMTLLVRLPCQHHYRRPMLHRAFHCWPQLANRGWQSDREPRRSNHPGNRGGWSDRDPRQSDHPL